MVSVPASLLFVVVAFIKTNSLIYALFGTNNFFFDHDSSTTYERNGTSFRAKVTCWTAPNCNLTVEESWRVRTEYGCIPETRIRIKDGCPPVVCDKNCTKFVTNPKDGCPMCNCTTYMTREPCRCNIDCPKGVQCRAGLCNYAIEKKDDCDPEKQKPWNEYCQFQSDCQPFERCHRDLNQCIHDETIRYHITGKHCTFSSDCPNDSNYECEENACFLKKQNFCTDNCMCRMREECNKEVKICINVSVNDPIQVKYMHERQTKVNKKCSDCWFWQYCREDGTCSTLINDVVHEVSKTVAVATKPRK